MLNKTTTALTGSYFSLPLEKQSGSGAGPYKWVGGTGNAFPARPPYSLTPPALQAVQFVPVVVPSTHDLILLVL